MTLDEYQAQALTTAIFSGDEFHDLCHWVLAINGEAGEIAEKLKKIIRDQKSVVTDEHKAEMAKEIGDVLWYLAILANHLGVPFDEIAHTNIAKLQSRKQRDKIAGAGDNR